MTKIRIPPDKYTQCSTFTLSSEEVTHPLQASTYRGTTPPDGGLMSSLRFLFITLLLLTSACVAGAPLPPPASCDTPKSAADSLLVWQHAESYDLEQAITCVDAPEAQRTHLAVQLKQVLDAKGLYVPVDVLPDEQNFTNEEGKHEVIPFEEFPLILRRAEDGRWLYSKETMAAVPALYRSTFSAQALWFQQQLPDMFFERVGALFGWQYLYAILLFLIAFALGRGVSRLLRIQVEHAAERVHLVLAPERFLVIRRPLTALATLGMISYGLPNLQLPIEASVATQHILSVLLRVVGTWLGIALVDLGGDLGATFAQRSESKLDDQLIPLLRQAARLLVLVLGGLLVLDALGVDVWKLAAGVGIGGLAFALAAQDTVANFFGSINIFLDRPFQIGDWVVIGKVEGVVEEVGFRSTRVRTFYNSQVTIPNSQITNANVDNMGRRNRRRTKFVLGLTYDTPPDLLQAYVEGVRGILAAHPYVEKNSYEVHVWNLGDSALQILVYYHLDVPGWTEELETRSQNILEFLRLSEALGVSFAFPSSSVYIESSPEKPLTPRDVPSKEELTTVYMGFSPGGATSRPEGPAFQPQFRAQDLSSS